jgi:hypothetical protein
MTLNELQLSALKVLRRNFIFLALLGLFPLFAGLRVRDGSLAPYTNWPFVLSGAVLLPGLYFSILLVVAILQNAADAKRQRGGNLRFSGAIGYQLLFLTLVIFCCCIDIGIYRQNGQLRTVDVAFTLVMVLLVFYGWPRTIKLSDGALRQRAILGGKKSIAFSDVVAARFDARQQCIIVSGRNGATIVHSMFHAGGPQFASQLALLTGTRVAGLNVA